MIASLSAAISKSPRAFTAVMFGSAGTLKCSPGGKACVMLVSVRRPLEREGAHLRADACFVRQVKEA